MPRILLLLLTLLLAACMPPKVDPAREAQADQVYQMVRRSDASGLQAMGTDALRREDVPAAVRQMQAHARASEPTGVETLGWRLNTVNAESAYEVTRLYTHPEGKVQVRTLFARTGEGPWRLSGMNVARVTPEALQAYEAQIEAARFTLAGKSAAHYFVLIAAGLALITCVVSAVVAGFRRRWAWMIGCLFGLCAFSIDWTTGAWFVQPLYFTLLGAGAMKGLGAADPWMISASIPLPAILFWTLGKWRPKPPKSKPEPSQPAEDGAEASGS